ncbi:hypothetical protein SISSUDRAFT_1117117 [Sistotremastrum suecicum HHB10207 ss-3]|uniref:Uncharacterized protein n=1 Tax=Sistotremastrum suecicum HHB10207 ss-3 TaxID=1314776 RepID=A0A166H6A8_9AGAM|nr:hypothetical protein SISSUDRAFT_1117117 [Sistotremastrum suecicum HHB10207 ss-3]
MAETRIYRKYASASSVVEGDALSQDSPENASFELPYGEDSEIRKLGSRDADMIVVNDFFKSRAADDDCPLPYPCLSGCRPKTNVFDATSDDFGVAWASRAAGKQAKVDDGADIEYALANSAAQDFPHFPYLIEICLARQNEIQDAFPASASTSPLLLADDTGSCE